MGEDILEFWEKMKTMKGMFESYKIIREVFVRYGESAVRAYKATLS